MSLRSKNSKALGDSGSRSKRLKKDTSRIEAMQVTTEIKKKCNDKALQIVTDCSEGVVQENELLHNLKFINQEHYQDIIEERAINKLCGYPLCSSILKNVPSKQYHISTTLNKVFDITDRKNFCSNLCYKASKFLKDQVSTSPLWLREDDVSTPFTLISLQSKGGMSGEEVDIGSSSVKVELDNILSMSTDQNGKSVLKPSDMHAETDSKANETVAKSVSNSRITKQCVVDDNVSVSSVSCDGNSTSKDNSLYVEEIGSNEERLCGSKDQKLKNLESVMSAKSTNYIKAPKDPHFEAGKEIFEKTNLPQELGNTATISSNKVEDQKHISSSKSNNSQMPKHMTKLHKHSSKSQSNTKSKRIPKNINPVQNIVLKIEQILREWISIDSLCFIFGEEKIKEILAEKKEHFSGNKDLPAITQDIHLYERYLEICKKLNILELEDTKIDASYREETKKPLPDYEALKEKARQMDIKVKMFYKGDKVKFEETQGSNCESEAVMVEPVLPLVDLHAQRALRRRIVIDKLRRVLQDLQTSLGLRGFNLTEEIRTLVSTFTLSAHNITMKPAEWNLVSIAMIKLLSLREGLLAQSLNSSTTNKHLTLLLMSYSLDAGYLDRLMLWLTDVEAVLQKT